MTQPPLNIEYWSSLYPVYTDYAEEYERGMEHSSLVDRVESLWNWKGLNRSIEFDQIDQFLKQLDQESYTTLDPEKAIKSLSNELQDRGIVNSKSLVTSAFLLHLMASESGQYSVKFPIYDRRVWNAYVYLWRIRGDEEQLYSKASNSVSQYGAFCRRFSQTCPENKAEDYERALFMFGRFIGNLPPKDAPTPIEKIDQKMKAQEKALSETYERSRYALIDINEIFESD
ncbi:hypothetical protein [Halorubrum sp. DTA98]|uniref:hypothetical protein n=1 Tax=Halorubrum sp. DTA98 TaxID=3402163 RepID=UPI003AAB8B42